MERTQPNTAPSLTLPAALPDGVTAETAPLLCRPDQRTKSRSWLVRLSAVAALGLCCLLAYYFGAANSQTSQSPIIVLPETLNFGETWETAAFRWHLKFENVSSKTAMVSDLKTGCGCVKLEAPETLLLEPGERVTIPVILDLRQMRQYDPAEFRPVEVALLAKVGFPGEGSSESRWLLRGRVRRAFHCEPHGAKLGEELIAGKTGRALEFKLLPYLPLQGITIKRLPTDWAAEIVKGSSEYVLRATPKKTKVGSFLDVIELSATALGDQVLATQEIFIEGTATHVIEVFPRVAEMGNLPVGTWGKTELWLLARNNQAIEDAKVIGNMSHFKIAGVDLAGNNCRIDLEQFVETMGYGKTKGTIQVNSQDGNSYEIPFTLHWYGVADTKK